MDTLQPLAERLRPATGFRPYISLIKQMTGREILGRYRGSVLGVFWSVLHPLFMLSVYTFVFGIVFRVRWAGTGAQGRDYTTHEFAILLFAGLIAYAFFSEMVSRAPGLVLNQANLVKKVVFPLEILPVVALGSALFHAAVSVLILLIFQFIAVGKLPVTALWLPVVFAPFALLTLGVSWFLASLGVFLRDIAQVVGVLTLALLFLSPVFYPVEALPEAVRDFLFLNPLTLIISQTREVLVWGNPPDLGALAAYTLAAAAVAAAGLWWFQKTRKGFADVV